MTWLSPFPGNINLALHTVKWILHARRRCGICLFELDRVSKPLPLDLSHDQRESYFDLNRRPVRVDGLEKSTDRGCRCCKALLSYISKHNLLMLYEETKREWERVWEPKWAEYAYRHPHLDLCLPKKFEGLEVCINPEYFPGFRSSVHPYICPGTEVEGSTGSDATLQLAREWMTKCCTQHKKCLANNPGFLPTRLLFIGQESAGAAQLVVGPAGAQPWLPRCQEYAALSHRWSQETLQVKLLQSNLETRKECGILWAGFPRMMLDAFHVLRRLGIFYVWIDCMCIIQDDVEDWRREAAQMAEIYANATITIAACWCRGSGQSLFSDRDGYYGTVMKIPVVGNEPVFIRRPLPHFPTAYNRNRNDPSNFHDSLGGVIYREDEEIWPLLTRGWVYQEQALSRRILYFTQQEIIWSCNETTACECSYYMFSTKTRFDSKKMDVTSNLGSWTKLLREYTIREFTYWTDRLPALAGIAKAFAGVHGWTYIAGMWLEDLSNLLAWHSGSASRLENAYGPNSRLRNGAPTWSWASVKGTISFETIKPKQIDYLDHHVVTCGDKYLGQVQEAGLTILGLVFPATLCHSRDLDDAWENPSVKSIWSDGALWRNQKTHAIVAKNRLADFQPDYLFEDSIPSGLPVLCLKFEIESKADPSGSVGGLILRCVDEKNGLYERLGYCDLQTPYDQGWNKPICYRKRLTLI